MSNPVNWFEIPTENLERAVAFYEAALGFTFQLQDMGPLKMAWFPAEADGAGATGSLVQADHYVPSQKGTMVYLHVEEVGSALVHVEECGGKIFNPKSSIGEFGFVGHFIDSEGNLVGLHSDR